jgi:hypothetical protein
MYYLIERTLLPLLFFFLTHGSYSHGSSDIGADGGDEVILDAPGFIRVYRSGASSTSY